MSNSELWVSAEEQNFPVSPDVREFNQEGTSFKIAHVRKISQEILFAPIKEKQKKIIVHHFEKATVPAQNAFLKMLEEPPVYVQFILLTDNLQNVLPTVQSRCVIKHINQQNSKLVNRCPDSLINRFTDQPSYSDLIDLAGQYKERGEAIAFLENLIFTLHAQNAKQPGAKVTKQVQILDRYLKYLKQNTNVLLTLEECFFAIMSSK